jgi:hypothetical protein
VLVLCDKHAEEQGYIEDEDSISEWPPLRVW